MRYLYDNYESIDKVLDVESGQHTPLLKEFLGNNIQAETFIVFDNMFKIFEDYDELIQEQFIWPKTKVRLNKLKPFIEYEPQKIRLVMKGIWLQPTS